VGDDFAAWDFPAVQPLEKLELAGFQTACFTVYFVDGSSLDTKKVQGARDKVEGLRHAGFVPCPLNRGPCTVNPSQRLADGGNALQPRALS